MTSATAVPMLAVFYDPGAPEGCEMSVQFSETAIGFLSRLTDFELKVMAAEAALRVQKAMEIPPSPNAI